MSIQTAKVSFGVVVVTVCVVAVGTFAGWRANSYSYESDSAYGSLDSLSAAKVVFEGSVDRIVATDERREDLVVSSVRTVAVSPRLEDAEIAIVEEALAAEQVVLQRSGEHDVAEGQRYLFFAGLGSEKQFIVTFAQDLETDEPSVILLGESGVGRLEELAVVAGTDTTRELLMTLWRDMQAEWVTGERTALLEVMAGPVPLPRPEKATYVPDLDEDSYPATPIDATEEQLASLTPIEILLVADPSEIEMFNYGLVGKKRLVWFGGSSDRVFIAGYVPDGEVVSVVRAGRLPGGPVEEIIDLTKFGEVQSGLTLESNSTGEIRVVIDLRTTTTATDSRLQSLESQEFDRILESCTQERCTIKAGDN